jgi:predicted MFS family arabinose efflux permease
MRSRFSYALVLASAALCYMALGAVLRVLPRHVETELHGSALTLGLAVGAPALTAILTRPWGGRLADRYGPSRVLLVGACAMALGALPALIPDDIAALLGSRLAAGAGEGLMMSAAVLWLLRIAGPARRGRAIGHIGLANYAGLVLGPLLALALPSVGAVLAAAVVLPPLGALCSLSAGTRPGASAPEPADAGGVLAATLRPGVGLLLVNVGYAAVVGFGAQVAGSSAALPLFAVCVIVARALGSGVPQRLGARRVAVGCALVEAAGLAATTLGGVCALIATVVLAGGQALAVPALGVLALADVPHARHGAAAGTFFAYFDAGVGLGGPLVGALVAVGGADEGMLGAALAVALVAVVVTAPHTRTGRSRRRSHHSRERPAYTMRPR